MCNRFFLRAFVHDGMGVALHCWLHGFLSLHVFFSSGIWKNGRWMSQIVELGSNSRRNVSQDRMCQQDDLQLSSRYLEKQCYKICIHFSSFFFFFWPGVHKSNMCSPVRFWRLQTHCYSELQGNKYTGIRRYARIRYVRSGIRRILVRWKTGYAYFASLAGRCQFFFFCKFQN